MEPSTVRTCVTPMVTAKLRFIWKVQLKVVDSFKYFGAILSKDDSCTVDIHIRITTVKAITWLDMICQNRTIRFATKYRLYKAHVVPIMLFVRHAFCLPIERGEFGYLRPSS